MAQMLNGATTQFYPTRNRHEPFKFNEGAHADPAPPRRAPHNLELEQALIGALFLNNDVMDEVSSFLEPDHFFDPLHQQIYETVAKLIHAGKIANPITLRTFFENARPISPSLTVDQYLGTLAANATTTKCAASYGRSICDLAIRRALIVECEEAISLAFDSPVDAPAQKQLDELHSKVGNLLGSCGSEALSVSRCLADVEAEHIRWIWTDRFALGKLSLVAGVPGLGKSQLMCAFAAAVTTGATWPDGAAAPLGSVIVVSCEDDAADTIKPRLEAAGADVSRVHLFEWTLCRSETGALEQKHFDVKTDAAALAELIHRLRDVRLIIVDPVTAYMGRADSHRTADVRAALAPLQTLAAESGTAVVLVSHLNKNGSDSSAMNRVTGSGAFVALCRSAWLVAADPQDEEKLRRILTPIKNNIGDDKTGFAFTIEGRELPNGIKTSSIVFDPFRVFVSADDLLQHAKPDGEDVPSALREACEFLREELAEGPQTSKAIYSAARDAGISMDAVKRARKSLGIRRRKDGQKGPWQMELPTRSANEVKEVEGGEEAYEDVDGAYQPLRDIHTEFAEGVE